MALSWGVESKTIYLAPRHPIFDRDVFIRRWRGHGELAMSLPLWRHASRYSQCDVIPRLESDLGLPQTSEDHWGLGIVWLRSVDALRAMTTDSTFETLYQDEMEAFGEYVENFTLLATEAILRDAGSIQFKLTTFFSLAAETDPDRVWLDVERWALEATESWPGLERIVLNKKRDVVYVGVQAGGTVRPLASDDAPLGLSRLSEFDGVLELGFRDLGSVAAFVEGNGNSGLPHALALFTRAGALSVVTNEILLYSDA
jgi:hypothetical protein